MSTLDNLARALADFRAGGIDVHAFARACRAETALLAALPPQFGEVLDALLMRLESSGLFSEESCSFSREDLLRQFDTWLEKARARLVQS